MYNYQNLAYNTIILNGKYIVERRRLFELIGMKSVQINGSSDNQSEKIKFIYTYVNQLSSFQI